MGYVDDHLLPGEQVKYRTHLHKLIFAIPGLVAALLTGGAVWAFAAGVPWAGLLLVAIGFVPMLVEYIKYTSSEFAVTDKRVIIKVGWIRRRTLETMLSKVEGIGVEQGIVGRLLGFGTLTITGTGGTKEPFAKIANPFEFRRQVQGQVSAADGRAMIAPHQPITERREERDCPHCAERILTRARICKHCGRDVEPLATA